MATFTITAGHSNSDPGACAFGRTEAEIVVDAREIVKYYLELKGHTVLTDGKSRKQNLSLTEAIKLIEPADIAIELHCNAASPSANGVETLAHSRDAQLAKDISGAICEVTGWKLRREEGWYKDAEEHHRFGYVRNGGLIVELFFITNKEELKVWDEKKWLICKAIANALMEAVA